MASSHMWLVATVLDTAGLDQAIEPHWRILVKSSARVSLERCKVPLNYQTLLRAFDSSRNIALEPASVSRRIVFAVNLFS